MNETLTNSNQNSEISSQWDNLINYTNEAVAQVTDVDNSRAEVQEIEATPEDYENFAKQNFVNLLDALSNPNINIDNIAEQQINAQIAITANIISSLDTDTSNNGQIRSKDIFDRFNDMYQKKYQESATHGQTRIAELNQRLVDASNIVKNQFDEYIIDHRPAQPGDLPGGIIK